MPAACMALVFWSLIVPQEQTNYRVYFAPNDLANIAAEAAVLAPWLEDILPRIKT